jgi:hypothetical protein
MGWDRSWIPPASPPAWPFCFSDLQGGQRDSRTGEHFYKGIETKIIWNYARIASTVDTETWVQHQKRSICLIEDGGHGNGGTNWSLLPALQPVPSSRTLRVHFHGGRSLPCDWRPPAMPPFPSGPAPVPLNRLFRNLGLLFTVLPYPKYPKKKCAEIKITCSPFMAYHALPPARKTLCPPWFREQ